MATQLAHEDLAALPEVADRLGVHRATVNDMVRAGRLPAVRIGAHWFVRRDALEAFAASYVKPSNAPQRRDRTVPESAPQLAVLLADFGSAAAIELAQLIDLHEGNVRKHLRLMEAAGLVERRADGQWQLTSHGADLAKSGDPAKSAA